MESEALLELPFAVIAGPHSELEDRTGTRRTVRIPDLAGLPFVDWLRDDPYGGANSARFAEHDVAIREVARVESFLQLYDFLRAFRACAIAPDLRRLKAFPPDIRAWSLKEERPQTVAIVAMWPDGGLSTAAGALLAALRHRIRTRR